MELAGSAPISDERKFRVSSAAACLLGPNGCLWLMANESGGLVKTRARKSRGKAARVNGVRIEYDASPVENASRRKTKGHSREPELPQDYAATSRAKGYSKRSTVLF